MELIKKYQNRKYYSTEQSRYVTLNDLLSYVLEDKPILVVNNDTKEDITTSTLLTVLAEVGKKKNNEEVTYLLLNFAKYLKGGANELRKIETVVQQ